MLDLMRYGPVIPAIVINDLEHALPLARALVAGGVRVLELTLRTKVALQAVELIANEVEGAIVGVGTITRPQDFEAAIRAGAAFGVSPGLTPELIAASHDCWLPLLPGVATPTEVIAARGAGFLCMKLFPAQVVGGVQMLKALQGPFPDVRFCPTGGISAATAPDFLALPNVECVGGSWLTPSEAVDSRDWTRITSLSSASSHLGGSRATGGHRL